MNKEAMPKNRGVALITVLLILALITPIIAHVALKQRISISRTTALDITNKSILYTLSIENLAKSILTKDAKDSEHNQYDGPDEAWAKEIPNIIDDGTGTTSTAQVVDLQGKMNINQLALKEHESFKKDWLALLSVLEIDGSKANTITTAIEEWVTTANVGRSSGEKDTYYMNLDKPYRTANQQINSISELRLLRGMDNETWELISPYITALPVSDLEVTPINVNTASFNVLKALFPTADEEKLKGFIDERNLASAKELSEFYAYIDVGTTQAENKTDTPATQDTNKASSQSRLGVSSEYFQLKVVLDRDGEKFNITSSFSQKDGKVIMFGRYF